MRVRLIPNLITMRTGRLVLGLFILTIGLAWLLSALGWRPEGWSGILPYWPVLLILWGLAVMVPNRGVQQLVAVVATVFAGVWVVSWFDPLPSGDALVSQRLETPALTAPATETDSEVTATAQTATLRFDNGAGSFVIQKGEDERALTVNASAPLGQYNLEQTTRNGQLTARVWYDQNWKAPTVGMMRQWRNEAEVGLSSRLPWVLEVNVGAAELTIDGSELKLEEVTISAGASDINLTLSDRLDRSRAVIKAGASDITVRVPRSSGVRAELATGLTGRDLGDLKKVSDRVWQSDGYDTASRTIELKFETGVSDITVERY